MKSINFSSIFCSCCLLFVANLSFAQNSLTIDFYAVGKDAYDGETLINSVLRVPKNTRWATAECLSTPEKTTQSQAMPCSSEIRRLVSQCKIEVQKIINDTVSRLNDTLEPRFAVVPLSKTEKGLLFESHFGGSGGARYDWSIFILKSIGKDKYSCPGSSFLAGVEITPGGNSWYESSCKKQEYDACAENLFYPKENAFRIEFTKSGTLMSKIPKGYIPKREN